MMLVSHKEYGSPEKELLPRDGGGPLNPPGRQSLKAGGDIEESRKKDGQVPHLRGLFFGKPPPIRLHPVCQWMALRLPVTRGVFGCQLPRKNFLRSSLERR
jgi:hypothetical protein